MASFLKTTEGTQMEFLVQESQFSQILLYCANREDPRQTPVPRMGVFGSIDRSIYERSRRREEEEALGGGDEEDFIWKLTREEDEDFIWNLERARRRGFI